MKYVLLSPMGNKISRLGDTIGKLYYALDCPNETPFVSDLKQIRKLIILLKIRAKQSRLSCFQDYKYKIKEIR